MKIKGCFKAVFIASILVFANACSAIGFDVEDVKFSSHGVQISGAIVFPNKTIVAAVVFVHGSGRQERNLWLANKFAAEGIAALVYDKRGVGDSEGEFVQKGNVSGQNLNLLADDAVAALEALYKHPDLKDVPVGFAGISQAGWIIPLAAAKSSAASFIGLWSGPVCKVSEEDIYSAYTSDRDFDNLPGFEEVRNLREKPYEWPESFGRDTDSGEDLKLLDIPGFWIFGENDGSIPTDLSISRLKELKASGKNYDYVVFSGLGHNNMEPTFSTMTDWIKRTADNLPVSKPAKSGTLKSEALDKFLGVYTSTNPPIEVSVTKENAKLFAETKGEIIELEHISDNSFFSHDTGSGYIFLDFYPGDGKLIASEHGNMYTLKKIVEN